MNKLRGWLALLLALAALALAGVFALKPPPPQPVKANLVGLPETGGDFSRADGPREFQFPQDMGPHPDFQTEWWYYTGNLQTADGRRFGYQLTFFRRAAMGKNDTAQRGSDWGISQVYLAHFSLTDAAAGQFQSFERFERGAVGLAGAQAQPVYQVWLHDWQVQQTGTGAYHLYAAQDGFSVDLTLQDAKGIILEGDHGYSQKGPEPGNASYYVSQTRLASSGKIQAGGQVFQVSGLSWMDHEFSTSALSPDLVGWDWFSIQLDDGSELMVYSLRRKDGSTSPYSSGTIIRADGTTRALKNDDFAIQVESTWRSPHSGGTYPSAWTVDVPAEGLTLRVKPLLAGQELNTSIIYWEGAVNVDGVRGGKPVKGSGYTELTGYAQDLQGKF